MYRQTRLMRGTALALVLIAFGIALAVLPSSAAAREYRPITAISQYDGAWITGINEGVTMSEDGRYIAFDSYGGQNGTFLFDQVVGTMGFIAQAHEPHMSARGEYIAFHSLEPLLPDDTNASTDIYVLHLPSQTLTRASMGPDMGSGPVEANGFSTNPVISGDGRFVAFKSTASNLVADDTNNNTDIFIHDRFIGITLRANLALGPDQIGDFNNILDMSDGGFSVLFVSSAENLVPNDTNGQWDFFVYDIAQQTVQRVNIATDGSEANGTSDSHAAISGDGRYVTFTSWATNLTADTVEPGPHVYRRDLQTGETTLVSPPDHPLVGVNNRAQDISADGRFVLFVTDARYGEPLREGLPALSDLLVYDHLTGTISRVTETADGTPADGATTGGAISADGRVIAFTSRATNLGVSAGGEQVYLAAPEVAILSNGNYEINDNRDFLPDGWIGRGFGPGDRQRTNKVNRPNGKPDRIFAYEGDSAFQFRGTGHENNRLVQKISGSQLDTALGAGDQLMLRAFVKAEALRPGSRIRIVIVYADPALETQRVNLPLPRGNYPYTEFNLPVTLQGQPSQVRLVIQYKHPKARGFMWVDNVSLIGTVQLAAQNTPLSAPLPAAPAPLPLPESSPAQPQPLGDFSR